MGDISFLCPSSLKPELFFVKLLQKVEAVYLEELIQVLPFHQIFTVSCMVFTRDTYLCI